MLAVGFNPRVEKERIPRRVATAHQLRLRRSRAADLELLKLSSLEL